MKTFKKSLIILKEEKEARTEQNHVLEDETLNPEKLRPGLITQVVDSFLLSIKEDKVVLEIHLGQKQFDSRLRLLSNLKIPN
jgi:hypothetical protein